jgi:hypothetical protein
MTELSTKIMIFSGMILCRLVDRNQHFEEHGVSIFRVVPSNTGTCLPNYMA